MLYNGRYLICVLDKHTDNILYVFDNPKEFSNMIKKNVSTSISRAFVNPDYIINGKYKIEFIDCMTVNNDIFMEEDKIFIDFVKNNININKISNKNLCKILHISERTFYRKIKNSKVRQKVFEKYAEFV